MLGLYDWCGWWHLLLLCACACVCARVRVGGGAHSQPALPHEPRQSVVDMVNEEEDTLGLNKTPQRKIQAHHTFTVSHHAPHRTLVCVCRCTAP